MSETKRTSELWCDAAGNAAVEIPDEGHSYIPVQLRYLFQGERIASRDRIIRTFLALALESEANGD